MSRHILHCVELSDLNTSHFFFILSSWCHQFDQSLGDTRNSPYMTDMDTYRYSTCGQLSPTELPTKWLWEMVQDDNKSIIPQLQAAIWLQHVPEGSCCPHLGRVDRSSHRWDVPAAVSKVSNRSVLLIQW